MKDVDPAAVVQLSFEKEIRALELDKVYINDSAGKKVEGVKAAINGKNLILTHNNFKNGTTYTVYIPAGTVGLKSGSEKNRAISWSFTTKAASVPSPVPPAPGADKSDDGGGCTFSDLPSSHWAAALIQELCQKDMIKGYPGGIFSPENSITRAEFTKLIVKAAGLGEVKPPEPTFVDVKPGDWYYGYVEAAAGAGLVTGTETREFLPNEKITREQLAVILVRGMHREAAAQADADPKTEFADDREIALWARGSVFDAVQEGLVSGYPDNTFRPQNSATRSEACAMVSRYLNK
jgi:hypothetical protein